MTNNTTHSNLATLLAQMEAKVFTLRPQLKKIQDTCGSLSYFDYIRQKTRMNPHKSFTERKQEVVDAIKSETSRMLGTAIAGEVEKQLKKNDSISTAEHTGPLGTFHVLNAGLHHSLPMFGNPDPRFRNIIILACSSVSFANELSFSRGFQFHIFTPEKTVNSTLSFFGRSVDAESVMYAAPYTIEAVEEMKRRLEAIQRETAFSPEKKQAIKKLLTSIYSSPHALSGGDYVDQMTITNYYFWKQLFPSLKESHIPNYIMLSQEKIVLNLLMTNHLTADTPIHRFLFNPTYLDLIEKHFPGVIGAFSADRTSGTLLFWGYSKKDRTRFQLFHEGNTLINKDKTYILPLTPDAVASAIKKNEIFPGLLLTFVILSFYYGLILGGGASQTTYLTEMQKRYIAMLKEIGDEETIGDAESSITDDFVYYRPHLAFLQNKDELISATPLDMYLYQDSARLKNIIQATKSITLSEFMKLLLPTLYKSLVPAEERDETLMNISRQEVEEFIGLDKRLPTIGTIS